MELPENCDETYRYSEDLADDSVAPFWDSWSVDVTGKRLALPLGFGDAEHEPGISAGLPSLVDLHKLLQFVTVAEKASFVKASAALHISQPALTRSIQALERHFGSTLLERERGRPGVVVTNTGRLVLAHARDLLKMVGRLDAEIAHASSHPIQSLAFGLATALVGLVLPDNLAPYVDGARLMGVDIMDGDLPALTDHLLAGRIEFFLSPDPGKSVAPRVLRRRVSSTDYKLWVARNHPLADQHDVPIEALASYTLASDYTWYNTALPQISDETRTYLTPSVRIDNFDLLVTVVRETSAVLASAYGDRTRQLVSLDIRGGLPAPAFEIVVFTREDTQLSEPAAETLELLESYLRHLARQI